MRNINSNGPMKTDRQTEPSADVALSLSRHNLSGSPINSLENLHQSVSVSSSFGIFHDLCSIIFEQQTAFFAQLVFDFTGLDTRVVH